MATVFISYAREDAQLVRPLYAFISEGGHKVWMDQESLLPGASWKSEIHRAIRESDFFIACLSRRSVNKRGYVQKEVKQACEILDEFPDGEIFIVPIKFDECEIPERFEELHCINWSEGSSRSLLLKTLASKKTRDQLTEQLRSFNLLSRLKIRTRYLYPELRKSTAAALTVSEPASLLDSTLEAVKPLLEELMAVGLIEFSFADDDAKVVDGGTGELIRRVQFSNLDLSRLRPLLQALEEER